MFNPEQAIATWREQMRSSGLKSRADLNELESHLRDELEQQFAKGLDGEHAFQAAVKQIGPVKALNAEFKKIDGAKKALDYKIKKVLCAIGFGIHAWFAIHGLYGSSFDANLNQRLLGLAAVALTGFLLFAYIPAWRFAPLISSKKVRMSIAFGCAGAGALITAAIFNLMAFRFNLNTAELIVLVLWALIPMMVGGLFCTAILEAADRRPTSA